MEDVIGGKDAWENVDRADGEFGFLDWFGCFGLDRTVGEDCTRKAHWGKAESAEEVPEGALPAPSFSHRVPFKLNLSRRAEKSAANVSPLPNSAMSPRRLRRLLGLFLPGADTERGRADDYVLQGAFEISWSMNGLIGVF